MNISSIIDHTVDVIANGENRRKFVVQRLLPLKYLDFSSSELAEKKLVFPISKWIPNGLVAGVDSGFVAKRLATIDLVLIRAMGVLFEYSDGKVVLAKYHPGYFNFPQPHLAGASLEDDEAEQSKSLMRLKEEVGVSKKIIEEYSPKYLFIDGSIVPQYQDKPRKESELTDNYHGIISEFESLYALAQKHNTTLIATVEDSRGSRFRSILQDNVVEKMGSVRKEELDGIFDSSLLEYFLQVGERSCAFTYTKNIRQHPVLVDFNPQWAEGIYGLYVKPSALDRPLRVEFICHNKSELFEKADEIASVATALSSLHREYAYPSVLIEADFHAKLNNNEIDIVYNKIMDKLGASVKMRMRRDNRPF